MNHKKRIKLLLLGLLGTIIIGQFIYLVLMPENVITASGYQNSEIVSFAEDVMKTCMQDKHHPSCYDREIPKLMKKISMENAFNVTKLIQKKDTSYLYCHVLGHKLSAVEVRKDPENWKNVMTRCPVGVCANGCHHGVLQEHFRSEYLTDAQITAAMPDLKEICEEKPNWRLTGFEQANCYHGLGHLTMFLTNGDMKKAVQVCDQTAKKDDGRDLSSVCYDGLFMQLFQPVEPEDIALAEGKIPTKEQLTTYCSGFIDQTKQESCWIQGWILYKDEIEKPEGLVTFCETGEPLARESKCYDALFHVIAQTNQMDSQKLQSFCAAMPQQKRGSCFANVASAMIDAEFDLIDDAISICAYAYTTLANDECYTWLADYASYNYQTDSQQFETLCNGLPSQWKKKCLAKQ
jgi:hypothetical protein